ncbi:sensor histidine kinase [Paenibacillus sp. tmac-D7]|uniref:sensor histidine kinase n=1 Tax=Paenibacillus sp. tmac-D7 TaxID=2591462 RepID=UPI001C6404B3|nr:sensor histidine kinase [Paenibacillus sp. tmac-D7]
MFASTKGMNVKHLYRNSIRFKLLLYFVLIILISIVTLSAVGSTMYQRSIEESTNEHTSQMMGQVKNNISFYFTEMENIIEYIAQDREVRSFYAGQTGDEWALREVMRRYEERHGEIAGILLVNRAGGWISNRLGTISRDRLTSEAWYREAVERPDELHMISKPIGRNIKADHNYSADQVLSFVKAIKDPLTGNMLGVVLIDMKLNIIQQTIESVSLGKSGFIYMTDRQGGIVYSSVNPVVYRIKAEWMVSASNDLIKTINGRSYQIMHTPFQNIGWKIVGVFPLDESRSVITRLQFYTVLVVLVTLVLAFAASWFFTNSIISPVRKLRSLMRKVEEGELNLRFRSRSNDEIGQLGHSFNKMVQEIERLIHMVYTEQKEKREAELKILQAQIKPHFLYNTLDTIQWMAQDRKADDIVEIIGALTNLFRIGLSKGHEIIRLSEELKHVESYLIIQMARYEGKLNYEIRVAEELEGCSVLKLILQPLVENAIYHGIKTKRGSGRIRIEAVKEQHKIRLRVEDDGLGMKPEQIEYVRMGLQGSENPEFKSGYGLFNVHERIRLTYGSSYGVQVESEYGKGTCIDVYLPFVKA